jgi:replicative DNA helicase
MTMLATIKNKRFDELLHTYIARASERAWIVDAAKFTASDIIGYMELARNKWNGEEPQFTFIDYAQLIRPEQYTIGKDKRHQVDESMKLITGKAVSSGSVIMIASQLSRMAQNENFESTTAFKESSALEEDSAVAILLKREKGETGEYQPWINVSVVKNRYGKIMKQQIFLIPEIGYLYK